MLRKDRIIFTKCLIFLKLKLKKKFLYIFLLFTFHKEKFTVKKSKSLYGRIGIEPANLALITAGHFSDTTGTNTVLRLIFCKTKKCQTMIVKFIPKIIKMIRQNRNKIRFILLRLCPAIFITVGNNWNI